MKVKNINSASQKTENKIKESFAELLSEKKELKNITVTELVKKAGITRSSFYTHYENIYEVAKCIQDETLDVLMNSTNIHSTEDVFEYFDKITKYLKENSEIYEMILASDEPLKFTNRLSFMFYDKLDKTLNYKNNTKLKLNVIFFTEGCISLIIKFFRKEIDVTIEDINTYIKELFVKIFNFL